MIRQGNSYYIIVPKHIAKKYVDNGINEVFAAVFDYSEIPDAKELLKWIIKNSL
jgi:hypothetical protein